MTCQKCKSDSDEVVDSRTHGKGTIIRRRRRCKACGHLWTTYEVEMTPEKFRFYDGDIAKQYQSEAEQKIHRLIPVIAAAVEIID